MDFHYPKKQEESRRASGRLMKKINNLEIATNKLGPNAQQVSVRSRMSQAKQMFVSQASLNTSGMFGFSGKFGQHSVSSKPNTMKISFPQFLTLEEDEIAQAEEIFRHFDFGNNGRVKTNDLPDILRLL